MTPPRANADDHATPRTDAIERASRHGDATLAPMTALLASRPSPLGRRERTRP
ncbi:hypothetical protein [Trueperella abortisuis]|uniref:Uncharacterized protein n=1 Tax=Trueperella abortisuis TaxID=445930 RepID=A0ABT9PH31_9ACTO|nr:hypothetical protein [Trueperella abortisuis]MDP9832008.1 hypothetical protein [Trueperella abortisuis]